MSGEGTPRTDTTTLPMCGWTFRKLLLIPAACWCSRLLAVEPRTKAANNASVGCSRCRPSVRSLQEWLYGDLKPLEPRQVVTATIKIEPGHWLAGMQRAMDLQRPSRTAMAISSDGRFVVYSAIEENPGPQAKSQLYLRRMDQSEAKPITGTEGGINPFLSPDNRWVGFWADGKLKKVPVEGGVATTLCDVSLGSMAPVGVVITASCLQTDTQPESQEFRLMAESRRS